MRTEASVRSPPDCKALVQNRLAFFYERSWSWAYKFAAAVAFAFVTSSEALAGARACVHRRPPLSAGAAWTARPGMWAPHIWAATDGWRRATIRDNMDARARCSLGGSGTDVRQLIASTLFTVQNCFLTPEETPGELGGNWQPARDKSV